MALDKFINSVRSEVAKRFDLKTDAEIDAFFIGMEESAKDNQEALEKRDKMLRDTVAELCEAKRLLKAAVGDLNATVAEVYNGGIICEYCKWESQIGECSCPNDGGCDTDYQWRYADEALALIGDESDGI